MRTSSLCWNSCITNTPRSSSEDSMWNVSGLCVCIQSLLRWKRHEASPSLGPWGFLAVSITLLIFDFYTEVLKRDAVRGIPLWRTVIKQRERSVMEPLLQDALRGTNCIFSPWLDLIPTFSFLWRKTNSVIIEKWQAKDRKPHHLCGWWTSHRVRFNVAVLADHRREQTGRLAFPHNLSPVRKERAYQRHLCCDRYP